MDSKIDRAWDAPEVDVRPERSLGLRITRTNDWAPWWRPMFVAGISCTRPKTRAFVTERIWAYQTKSAFSDTSCIVSWRSIRNEKGTALAAPCLSHFTC